MVRYVYVLALCPRNFLTLDEKLWPQKNCKIYCFSLKKAIFRYPAFECCQDHDFTSRITKFCMHNLITYTYQQQKSFALAHSGRWQFQFEVRSYFPPGVHFVRFRTNSICANSRMIIQIKHKNSLLSPLKALNVTF